jgi:hypothetical protein
MSLSKLSLVGIYLIIPDQGELVSDIPAGVGNLFYRVSNPRLEGGVGAPYIHPYIILFVFMLHICVGFILH